MTSPSDRDEAQEARRPDPLDGVPFCDMRRVSVQRLERMVADARSEDERAYHEARWDQVWGR